MGETAKELSTFDEAKVITSPERGLEEIQKGNAMMKSEVLYHTAIMVQRPRDLDAVVKAVEREAEFAGDDFYYRWPVKDKGKTKIVEGGTIGCALAIAREWTNCAIPIDVEEKGNRWIFTGAFVDLERGFTIQRTLRKKIPSTAPGKYDEDRWEDMSFQNAQSKAIRNAIFAGVPRWLRQRAIDKAKEAALKNINKMGIDTARNKAVEYFAGYGVTEEQIKTLIGKPLNSFSADDVQTLRNIGTQIKNGDVAVKDIFENGDSKKLPEEKKKTETPTPPPEEKPKKETKAKKDKPEEKEKPKEEEKEIMVVCPDQEGEMRTAKFCNENCKMRDNCPAWGDSKEEESKSLLED